MVQDIDRLFETLSKADELKSDLDTEGEQDDPVVVEPDMAVEDAQKVPGETPVKEEENEKKGVKIVESDVKKGGRRRGREAHYPSKASCS